MDRGAWQAIGPEGRKESDMTEVSDSACTHMRDYLQVSEKVTQKREGW